MSQVAYPSDRPTSVTVFGILHLIFGSLGLCGTLFSISTMFTSPPSNNPFMPDLDQPLISTWMIVGTVLGIAGCVIMAVAGFGLLQMKPWARTTAVIYAIYSVVMSVVGVFVNYYFLQMNGAFPNSGLLGQPSMLAITLVSSCLSMIYPIATWYFLTRPHVMAVFDARTYAAQVGQGELARAADERAALPASSNPFAAPQMAMTVAPLAVAAPSTESDVVSTLLPARNAPALAAYYLGLFSIFPLLGLPMAIVAIVLGVKGLRRVRATPEVHGTVHAWVGIVCGAIFGAFNLLLTGLFFVGLVATMTRP